ncbi:NAD(P)/FAD-dependent oxidoreductase [Calidifontibacter sp. DB0510]|uniref:NAD(P)/FAD-dependent oxidoreductase n=1 Tax=Metallococcus carri TaxID=1656884 RepID=A0A967EBC5_9MICO|nr:NAD(P)/FAD-dependent oxidoreductase [Metallococcus carri]NHN57165.1 NAD(P)/FAD-dependent oxidoreductase [Metallococcus carri]NOP38032.1 NAD(P)/FAD-dependent oxidoreductase [Calidifontibacter sp. DB2511S]
MQLKDHYDVIVVGAGLSGIDAGYRLQTMCPDKDYAILESRAEIGGTWNLFTYPGVRSDSDMYTLGFPFEPWRGRKAIADGEDILQYVKDTAAKYGIDERIAFEHKVIAADWSSKDAQWTLQLQTPDGPRQVTTHYLYLCSGYYNYDHGYTPDFPGVADFTGQLIHPQFWPQDFDPKGKRVVVIGSGATAMTLVPALADRGAQVTMLQRSPTYVLSMPGSDPLALALRGKVSAQRAFDIVRMKNAVQTLGFYKFTRKAPNVAAKVIIKQAKAQLMGGANATEADFTPRYKPWDQRVCIVPNGDLFRALRAKKASIVTDTVDSFVPEGVRTGSGKVLEADAVVTATGLSMLAGGGITVTVDDHAVDLGDRHIYRGLMIEGLPNAAMCVGYTNASWTLRADLSSRYFCTFINYVDGHGYAFGYPKPSQPLQSHPALDLTSGYVQRAMAEFPKQGHISPWLMRQSYFKDRAEFKKADVTHDMVFALPGENHRPERAAAQDPVLA